MATKQLNLLVRPRGKPIRGLPEDTSIASADYAHELYRLIARESNFDINRLRITKGSDGSLIPNAKYVTVHDTGLRDRSTINVKDLGPQIGWRTCYIIEYLGPLVAHPLVYALRPYIYRNAGEASQLQTLTMALITLHFLKREIETIFIHRFSAATMPFRNVFKNSFHYWLLAGVNVAYWVYAPNATAATTTNPLIAYIGTALFLIGELGNLNAHLVLRSLRTAGTTERGIPKGLGFDLVTCPNYMFEAIAWIGMIITSLSLSTAIFAVLGIAQMAVWAKKREMRYRKEFPDKYKKKRYSILPGIF